jgi:hypothetical protein
MSDLAGVTSPPAGPSPPSPRDYAVLIVGVSVSLALLILVGFSMYLVGGGHADQLGKVEGVGKGTGVLGVLSLVVYLGSKFIAPRRKMKAIKQSEMRSHRASDS